MQINEDKNGEKIVQLTSSMMLHAILLNIEQLIRKSHGTLRLQDLQAQYVQVYRNELNAEDFGYANLESLLLTMTDKLDVGKLKFEFVQSTLYFQIFQFHYVDNHLSLSLKESNTSLNQLAKNIIWILMCNQCQLSFWQLKQELFTRFKQDLNINLCRNEFKDYIQVYFTIESIAR